MPRPPSWNGPAPADIAAWTIVQAGHAVGRRFWSALGEVGLTPIQFGVLLQLDLQPGMSNAALARTVLVTPQSMSELLAGLDELGLVDRDEPAGRGHARRARITMAGRRRLRECESVIAAVEESLGLTSEGRRQLITLLHTAMRD